MQKRPVAPHLPVSLATLALLSALAACGRNGPTADGSAPADGTLKDFPKNAGEPRDADAGPVLPFGSDGGSADAGSDGGASDGGASDGGSQDAGPPDAGAIPFRPLLAPGAVAWANTVGGEHAAPNLSIGAPLGNISGTGSIELVTGGIAIQTVGTGMSATDLATRKQLWTYDTHHPIGAGHFVSDGAAVCALTFPSSGGAGEQLHCVRLADGVLISTALPGHPFAPDPDLAIHDGVLFIASTNHAAPGFLQAFDFKTGQLLFERAVQPHHRALVFAGQRVLVEGSPCPASNAGCIEALDERTGALKATFPIAPVTRGGAAVPGWATFLWQKGCRPYFRYPLDPPAANALFATVTYETATDSFVDSTAAFASLNATPVPAGTTGSGGFDLQGLSDPMADGAVYGVAMASSGERHLCRFDSIGLRPVWCVDPQAFNHLQALPNLLFVTGSGTPQALFAATGAVPNGKNAVAFCAERWCFDPSGSYAAVAP